MSLTDGIAVMEWWAWVILGLVLLGSEILTAGFFLAFFGLSALFVGLLASIRLVESLPIQLAWFALLSVVSLLLFRRPLVNSHRIPVSRPDRDDLYGAVATAMVDLPPGEIGRIELRGTVWSGRNVGARVIAKGDRCTVSRVDGLLLEVMDEDG